MLNFLNISNPADVLLGCHSFIKRQMLPMSASAHSCGNYSIRGSGFQPFEIKTGMTLTTGVGVMDVSLLQRRMLLLKGNTKNTEPKKPQALLVLKGRIKIGIEDFSSI